MTGDQPERVPDTEAAEPVAPAPVSAAAHAYTRGDLRALRIELARGARLSPQQRAALTLDPVHVAVLALCTAGLLAIALHYLGAA